MLINIDIFRTQRSLSDPLKGNFINVVLRSFRMRNSRNGSINVNINTSRTQAGEAYVLIGNQENGYTNVRKNKFRCRICG